MYSKAVSEGEPALPITGSVPIKVGRRYNAAGASGISSAERLTNSIKAFK